MSHSPHAVYLRWLIEHPRTTYGNLVPVGYKRCRNPSCIVLIAEQQQRDLCYGCGGLPDTKEPRRMGVVDDFREHANRLRANRLMRRND